MVVDRRSAFAFGATMLASAMINNIFVSYYMDYFMNVERISPSAFYIGGKERHQRSHCDRRNRLTF
jgi:hypothetical protein